MPDAAAGYRRGLACGTAFRSSASGDARRRVTTDIAVNAPNSRFRSSASGDARRRRLEAVVVAVRVVDVPILGVGRCPTPPTACLRAGTRCTRSDPRRRAMPDAAGQAGAVPRLATDLVPILGVGRCPTPREASPPARGSCYWFRSSASGDARRRLFSKEFAKKIQLFRSSASGDARRRLRVLPMPRL